VAPLRSPSRFLANQLTLGIIPVALGIAGLTTLLLFHLDLEAATGAIVAATGTMALLIAWGLRLLLQRFVSHPLRQLAEAADRVASGDLEARVELRGDNEISVAARAVNEMADTLVEQAASVRANESRLRALLQSASEAWFIIDADSAIITEVNDEATRLLGKPRGEIIGRSGRDFIPASDQVGVRCLIHRFRERGNLRNASNLHVIGPGGESLPVSVNAEWIHVDSETLAFVSVRDISEQRQSADTLAHQIRRLTAISETSRACSESLELPHVYQAITQQVRAVMPCDAFAISQWDEREATISTVSLSDTVNGEFVAVKPRLSGPLCPDTPTHTVIGEQRPVLIHRGPEESDTPGLDRFGDAERLSRSLLLVPMTVHGRTMGLISAQSYQPDAYTQEDLSVLQGIASFAALSIHNAGMHRETQRALQTREALNSIACAIGATFDLRQICQTVHREISALFPTDAFCLSIVEPEREHIEVLYAADIIEGKSREVPPENLNRPVSQQHTWEIVQSRRARLELRDPSEIPTKPFLPFGDTARRSASLMFAPMISRETVVGVMTVQSYTCHAHTHQDLALLQQIADLTALALQSALLYNRMATSEARHRALVENSDVSIILTDLEGHISMWNRGAERLFGHASQRVLGLALSEIFTQETFSAEHISDLLRRHGPWTAEAQARHCDGHLLEIVFSLAEVTGSEGEPIGRLVIASDVTEKKLLERALLQAQKMESIGTLAGGIAHDFNNLLTGIMGYASYLQGQAETGTRLSRDLNQIERAAHRASELTAQLLAFSRKQRIRHQAINLNQIIDETVHLMERTLGKHITIVVEKDSSLHVIQADPTQMQQALMNLAINSRDAMPRGGTLHITTGNSFVDESLAQQRAELTPGQHVVLRVSDTGEGMDEETRARIFDPFFTTKSAGEGTGLGLAMVYGIVRGHGGAIEVESEVGKGTHFTIHLPVGDVALESPEQSDAMEVRGGSETILLVDDEPVILRLGSSVLERYGYTVLTALGGAEALQIQQDHLKRIDLIVLDMIMPEMNGAELARHLREADPQCRLLLSSGYTMERDAEELIQTEGLIGFLPKPYRMSQLVQHVRRALDQPLTRV
jgi:PAS domain S-box-containing protein